ncbi:MAG: RNA pseudouridine synthase, partial [Spirochaetia bacterium]|nr:RNA pseudouridine synthase [Spirochaetia bacterium]
FARTSKAAARLSEQFRAHTVEKTYMAVIEGSLNAGSDWLMWQDTMAKDEQERKAVGAVVGQTARLQIREREHGVLRQGGAGSIVEVRLETGRYHQIRYQCSSRGHPIVGDVKYGAKSPWRGGGIALCAVTLSFDHPITKERMTLTVGNDPFERALER